MIHGEYEKIVLSSSENPVLTFIYGDDLTAGSAQQ